MLFIRGLKEDSMKISKCNFCKYRWECKSKENCRLEREKITKAIIEGFAKGIEEDPWETESGKIIIKNIKKGLKK